VPLAAQVKPDPGAIQKLTASCDALYVPDIDASLDDESAKRGFWRAFKSLGDWYAEFPPY
jgi:predicted RNase H-like nuclease (RuvC/YqgF family)